MNGTDKRQIIIFAGAIGAGKTTAANYIIQKYDFTHLSYVDLIWIPILQERGLPITRENLQNLGDELREKYGMRGLARKILSFIPENANVVIDDVRHPDAYDELKKSIGTDVNLIFVRSSSDTRVPRLKVRDNLTSINELNEVEKRKTEITISDLEPLATFIISNDGNLEDFYAKIDKCLSDLQKGE